MWRGNSCGRRGWSEGIAKIERPRLKKQASATKSKATATAKSLRHAGATGDCGGALFGFLHGFEVGFQGGAVLFLGFQFGLQFFHQELEAANFVAQFLGVG